VNDTMGSAGVALAGLQVEHEAAKTFVERDVAGEERAGRRQIHEARAHRAPFAQ
jgi:hypothetical protein